MKVYLDNAATTPIDPAVVEAMLPYLTDFFGNPSSTHSFGRTPKAAIEKVRKEIAQLFHCSTGEIVFTSGGTEADNMALFSAIVDSGVKRIITSSIEHHAVSHTAELLAKRWNVNVDWVRVLPNGSIDLGHLRELLALDGKAIVSLMHANNEIGRLLPLKEVALLCKEYGALLHSDTVQTVGHYHIDLQDIPVDFITCAAHKFHGPKGVGFLYVRKGTPFSPFITGGSQERDKRGGTENVAGIVGLGKALELAYADLEAHQQHITHMRSHFRNALIEAIPQVAFNCAEDGLYTVLNVNFPHFPNSEMLLFQLDLKGIACSGGSACSSGSSKGSHVLAAMEKKNDGPNVRFSFSKYTTVDELNHVVEVLKELVGAPVSAL
ncbi:MAG TPA: cysteine desulfurase family protein [Luteibaculaceae bacterium]|nr:cysteine desulfurase family protein [Luteibaculaceae bacterium]